MATLSLELPNCTKFNRRFLDNGKAVIKTSIFALSLMAAGACFAADPSSAPLRVGIISLEHGHVAGFLNGGALTPAGGALHRPDIQVVGIVEQDQQLFDKYAERFRWSADMHFRSIEELASRTHPDAALIFTSTAGHTKAVEECAKLGRASCRERVSKQV